MKIKNLYILLFLLIWSCADEKKTEDTTSETTEAPVKDLMTDVPESAKDVV